MLQNPCRNCLLCQKVKKEEEEKSFSFFVDCVKDIKFKMCRVFFVKVTWLICFEFRETFWCWPSGCTSGAYSVRSVLSAIMAGKKKKSLNGSMLYHFCVMATKGLCAMFSYPECMPVFICLWASTESVKNANQLKIHL